ncbi:Lanosterol synthase (Oxidosqualene--lanosterol cyclase) [Savitreella phatthalungensis]
MTDLSRWRLDQDQPIGVSVWRYLAQEESKSNPQSISERYFLGYKLPWKTYAKPKTALESARNGFRFFQQLQEPSGHWACFYGGPSFLLPGLIFAMYISETPFPEPQRIEWIKFIRWCQNDDGGWGMHFDGSSTNFGTSLYYVAARILGVQADDQLCVLARTKLRELGGAVAAPQWAKFWLAALGLFDWRGVNPVPSEFWLLPEWMPIHPWRWWIHTRVVYLPMSYIYSNRLSMPTNELLEQLKGEIYVEPFEQIRFERHRNNVSSIDLQKPHSAVLRLINWILYYWMFYVRPAWLGDAANRETEHLMRSEDENTGYADLAPVNKAMQMVASYYIHGRDSEEVRQHRQKVWEYMWIDERGMTSSGTNGVQTWDTAFAISTLYEAGLHKEPEFRNCLNRALDFLDRTQFRDDPTHRYRQRRKGGWPFSTKNNGYIVSDCAAEGLKSVLLLQQSEDIFAKRLTDDRLFECVDTLLTMQNSNGGFASYEKVRASQLLELLNPAEVFDRIMVEYCYVECSAAVCSSLSLFNSLYPDYRSKEIRESRQRAIEYIKTQQLSDGSFYGSWGICFTYGTMFALEAFALQSDTYENCIEVQRACDFLISKQREDGGWGESWKSSETEIYCQNDTSTVCQTSWALIGLLTARYPDREKLERGVKLLMDRQTSHGEWLQEDTEGVFNRTVMIGYPNYRHYFTVKALGLFAKRYE